MKLIDLTCTKCNATLQVNADLKKCICQYCGNEMLIDDETVQVHHQMDNAYQAGYQMEMGRQQAYVDMQNKLAYTQQQQQLAMEQAQKRKKKRRIILCLAGLGGVVALFMYKPEIGIILAIVVGIIIAKVRKMF